MWKRQYNSKGGRITSIQSTLSSLSICRMSILHLPRVVIGANSKGFSVGRWGPREKTSFSKVDNNLPR